LLTLHITPHIFFCHNSSQRPIAVGFFAARVEPVRLLSQCICLEFPECQLYAIPAIPICRNLLP
jgi:hypothetical protein